ncbi:MAG: hypothetical protein HY902_03185 [Deltaproteobacteria bacterium]|nr:hypothetical protein [Deltaproteobacteria bacterium]
MHSRFARFRVDWPWLVALGTVLAMACGGGPAPSPVADGQSSDSAADVQDSDSAAECAGDACSAEVVDQAVSEPPCLEAKPTTVDFGGYIPGLPAKTATLSLCNCGGAALSVTGMEVLANVGNPAVFSVNQQGLYAGGILAAPPPVSAANPIQLAPGACAAVDLGYAPTALTAAGQPSDSAVLQVSSNLTPPLAVPLVGVGVDSLCPVPHVKVQEGEETVPQTLLHLSGLASKAASGAPVTKYHWTVKQPAGSNQPLLPNANVANPHLLANAAGEYKFCLEVWDSDGLKSCAMSCVYVLVIPNDAIHIELLWDTPTDPDQTDTGPAAGADLDLHFGHPLATHLDLDCDGAADPWSNNPYDCYWFNAQPEWGSSSAAVKDNPSMDLDDTDGAGPENLNLIQPEGELDSPAAYSVGVHYWNDYGFGPSYATLSIFIQGGLALQLSKVKLQPADMWYVGKLWWPNTASGGKKPVFQTCYQSGASCPAKKNLMWQPKGEWCITPCYPVDPGFVLVDKQPSTCPP